jgi:hypothetical protein
MAGRTADIIGLSVEKMNLRGRPLYLDLDVHYLTLFDTPTHHHQQSSVEDRSVGDSQETFIVRQPYDHEEEGVLSSETQTFDSSVMDSTAKETQLKFSLAFARGHRKLDESTDGGDMWDTYQHPSINKAKYQRTTNTTIDSTLPNDDDNEGRQENNGTSEQTFDDEYNTVDNGSEEQLKNYAQGVTIGDEMATTSTNKSKSKHDKHSTSNPLPSIEPQASTTAPTLPPPTSVKCQSLPCRTFHVLTNPYMAVILALTMLYVYARRRRFRRAPSHGMYRTVAAQYVNSAFDEEMTQDDYLSDEEGDDFWSKGGRKSVEMGIYKDDLSLDEVNG